MKYICIYHKNCADGFGAALAVKHQADFLDIEFEFIPAHYGDTPPDVTGKTVYIVDFSYPRETLIEMNAQAKSLTVIDHHKTAKEALEGLDFCIFDMSKSGAVLTWEHLYPKYNIPELFLYIQDRDLWQWKLKYSKEISAALSSLKKDFDLWMQYVDGTHLPNLVDDKHVAFLSTYYTAKGDEVRGSSLDDPIHTITTENRHAIVCAHIEKFRKGGEGSGLDDPLHTITSAGTHHALVCAFLAKHYTGATGSDLKEPAGTVTSIDHHSLISAHMIPIDHVGSKNIPCNSLDDPLTTITSKQRHAVVSAFLIKHYGQGVGQRLGDPLHTITTKERFGLVTIKGDLYQIVDIGLRMLQPHELKKCQGFPEDYIIDRDSTGKQLTKKKQTALIGNSVCPPVATALVEANAPELISMKPLEKAA